MDGSGGAARFSSPSGLAVDTNGNIYVADAGNATIRRISPDGAVTTLAGSARQIGSADGTGTAARFHYPSGIALDSAGTLYVADAGNSTIRKMTLVGTNWVVSTLAGQAGQAGTNDGIGSTARFGNTYGGPTGLAVDTRGNIYVADGPNHTIRKVTPDGTVSTVAGSAGQSGTNDGAGIAARFRMPSDVAVDSAGNVYVADLLNYMIRKITPDRVVTTVAGGATGNGCCSWDGTGRAASFSWPQRVAVDSAGNLYVADDAKIRKIAPEGVVTTLAGSARGHSDGVGGEAQFFFPSGLAVDSAGSVFVADTYNHTIRKITLDRVVTTMAGRAGQSGSADATGRAATFRAPFGVAADSVGNSYVADTLNHTIRKITREGLVTTLAGSAGQDGTNDGAGSVARFNRPRGVAVDANGNVYVADSSNATIRRITPSGAVTTLAGSAGRSGTNDGLGIAARFGLHYWDFSTEGAYYYATFSWLGPSGVAVDSTGNVYVADTGNHTIRKIAPDGVVTTLAGIARQQGTNDGPGSAARFFLPSSVAVDTAANVYVADTWNSVIRKIAPDGVVTTLAGRAGEIGANDGTGSAARFYYPYGVAVDSAGNVFVTDRYNATIRKISSAGIVRTLAGSARQFSDVDGIGSSARFRSPAGVAVDGTGNLHVADTDGHRITKGMPLLQFDMSIGSLLISNGSFHVRLNGPPGSDVVVEASTNIRVWTPIQTNPLPPIGVTLSVPLVTNRYQLFRARVDPTATASPTSP